jgi:hypothetical protein
MFTGQISISKDERSLLKSKEEERPMCVIEDRILGILIVSGSRRPACCGFDGVHRFRRAYHLSHYKQ